jgi:hypothetical protein
MCHGIISPYSVELLFLEFHVNSNRVSEVQKLEILTVIPHQTKTMDAGMSMPSLVFLNPSGEEANLQHKSCQFKQRREEIQ